MLRIGGEQCTPTAKQVETARLERAVARSYGVPDETVEKENLKQQKITITLLLKEGQPPYDPVTNEGYPELKNFFTDIDLEVVKIESVIVKARLKLLSKSKRAKS